MLRRSYTRCAAAAGLQRTNLHSLHVAHKATMVPFCGWEMPLQFEQGIVKEHIATRESAGLFDVSHMGQVRFYGADRERFLEWVTVADIKSLQEGNMRLTVMLNSKGGVLDDLMVTREADHMYCVINAGRRSADIQHLRDRLEEFKGDVTMEVDENSSLLALQGPRAESVLEPYADGIDKLNFMTSTTSRIAGMPVRVSRCGYTGEDGFEISVANDHAEPLAKLLLENPATMNVGLGARNSLRLEAGMCLYGSDLTESTSLVSASLMWLVTKRRMEEGGFIGHEATLAIKANKSELAPRRRVGIVSKGLCPRADARVINAAGEEIGLLTSGCPSPTLGGNVGQAYVKEDHTKPGTRVTLLVGRRNVEGEIAKLPFVAPKYKK